MLIFYIFNFISIKVSNFIKQNEVEVKIDEPMRNGYFMLKLDSTD